MRPTFLLALMLSVSAPALAQAAEGGAPVLGDLLKQPAYFAAWQAMIGSETPPDWVTEYTATLNGPPVPNIPVGIDGQNYTLGFTCKPGECGDNQLFALFAPDGSKAWALMATAETGTVWLGYPDENVRKAITSALEN